MFISPFREIPWDRIRRENMLGGGIGGRAVGQAVITVDQEIDNDAWDGVVFDDGVGKNWKKDNPTRLTATEDGKYLIAASAELEAGNSNTKALQITFNGGNSIHRYKPYGTLHTLVPFDMVGFTVYAMVTDDYVELEMYQNFGNKKKLKRTDFSCIFSLVRIG